MDENFIEELESSDNESIGLSEDWNGLPDYLERKEKFLFGDPPSIDWDLLKSKLEQTPPVPKLNPVPQWLRLIDVGRRSVVRAPPEPFDYVCLSYTWGDVLDFQAKRDNIASLQQDGVLYRPENSEHPEGPDNPRLPATIQDALTVCQYLGKDYLWVDRLCIIQDGPDRDIQVHFDEMGRIYNHASVTLVAYEGGDARYGLHGISKPIEFGISDIDFWTRSEWSKRGWTYQEAILSRNMIVFAMGGVIFEHEGEATLTRKFDGLSFQPYLPMFHGAVDYYSAVENYTERELRHQEDILNAFSGICSHLFDKNHRFGLPTVDFNNAMHWFVKSGGTERQSSDEYGFPTWSWSSIRGRISFPRISPVLPIASWTFVNSLDLDENTSIQYPRSGDLLFTLRSSTTPPGHHGVALTRLAFRIYKKYLSPVKPDDTTSRETRISQDVDQVPLISKVLEFCKTIPKSLERSIFTQEFTAEQGQYPSPQQNPETSRDLSVGSKVPMKPIATDPRPFNPTMEEFVNEFRSYSKLSEFWRGTNPDSPGRFNHLRDFTTEQLCLAQRSGRILTNSWISTLEVTLEVFDCPNFEIQIGEGNVVGAGHFDDLTLHSRSRYDSKDAPAWSRELKLQKDMAKDFNEWELMVRKPGIPRATFKPREYLPSELGSRKVAFVALSASMASSWEIQRIASNHATALKNYFELFKDIPSGTEAPLVSVMAIEESNRTDGVFRRIGFGFINFQKWCDEIHRERRSIVLE